MNTEDELIKRIVRAVPSLRRGKGDLRLGSGDDAAILAAVRERDWVVSCDAFLEGVHFLAETHPPDSIGYKALARATSDLAAMGATPRFFLLTIALPRKQAGQWFDQFLRGMGRAARLLGIHLIGGDTTRSATVMINVTVFGQIAPSHAVTRSGARPGDLVYVSGTLGRAQLGLELALAGYARRRVPADAAIFLKSHLYPKIQVELGSWLARHRIASAMIDISDGLSTDLARLAEASGVGAQVQIGLIPATVVPRTVSSRLPNRALDPLQLSLHGGDDYELLFTVPPRNERRLRAAPRFSKMRRIGEITRDRRLLLVSPTGRTRLLEPRGWDPFRRQQFQNY